MIVDKFKFKIRVKSKETGKVISYLKISDDDRFTYDIFTGYQDNSGEDLYTGDLVSYDFEGYRGKIISEENYISDDMEITEFCTINDKGTAMPLQYVFNIVKKK